MTDKTHPKDCFGPHRTRPNRLHARPDRDESIEHLIAAERALREARVSLPRDHSDRLDQLDSQLASLLHELIAEGHEDAGQLEEEQ